MTWTTNGFFPDTKNDIIARINAIFVYVFGNDVNLDPASPNGQFIDQLANIEINNQNFETTITSSLYDPNYAQSVWLDSLCALSGIVRQAATYSVVTCLCSGSAGTVIPAGTQISNPLTGDVFQNSTSGTIGSGGTVDIVFTAVSSGAVPVNANTITGIINSVYGWDSVNNPTNGILGQTTESDSQLRANRVALLSTYGSSSLGSIYSAIYRINGLTSVFCAENNTDTTITVAGVDIVPYSIFVSIVGGSESDVAQAIYTKKAPGVNMTNLPAMDGGVSYTYTDPTWGNTFTAFFTEAISTPLQVNITVSAANTTATEAQIQQTIVNNFNGADPTVPSITAIKINQIINTSRFYPSLLAIGVFDIFNLTIELATGGTPNSWIQLDANLIGTLTTADVVVTFS
jgi:uncharacterized phage protein gp47/JayE